MWKCKKVCVCVCDATNYFRFGSQFETEQSKETQNQQSIAIVRFKVEMKN